MALSNAEKQKRYRERCRGNVTSNVTGNTAILQKILDELLWLRNQVTEMRYQAIETRYQATEMRQNGENGNAGNVTTPTPPYLKNPSDIDSCNQPRVSPSLDSPPREKPKSPKKAAGIPLDRWEPSPAHQQQAFLAGHDDAWLVDQADRYRDHQVNAKRVHKDREAGFRNWIRNAPNYEVKSNGHANGQEKKSPVEKLYEGAYRAVLAREARRRNSLADHEPLLDS